MIEKTFNVQAKNKEQMQLFESFINFIDTCCREKESRELTVFIDGSGDLEMYFEPTDKLTCPFSDFEKGRGIIKYNKYGEPYYWDLG